MHVLYPVLLDHRSPALGKAKAASRPAAMADMWREDGDNFALTAVTSNSLWLYFVTGHNILRRRVVLTDRPPRPPPQPPPPVRAGCKTLEVTGAGVAAANGLYTRAPAHGTLFVKDASHQIYPQNISGSWQWHLAHEGVAGSVIYLNANQAAIRAASGGEPPSWGWGLGSVHAASHVQIAPAPAALVCKGGGRP